MALTQSALSYQNNPTVSSNIPLLGGMSGETAGGLGGAVAGAGVGYMVDSWRKSREVEKLMAQGYTEEEAEQIAGGTVGLGTVLGGAAGGGLGYTQLPDVLRNNMQWAKDDVISNARDIEKTFDGYTPDQLGALQDSFVKNEGPAMAQGAKDIFGLNAMPAAGPVATAAGASAGKPPAYTGASTPGDLTAPASAGAGLNAADERAKGNDGVADFLEGKVEDRPIKDAPPTSFEPQALSDRNEYRKEMLNRQPGARISFEDYVKERDAARAEEERQRIAADPLGGGSPIGLPGSMDKIPNKNKSIKSMFMPEFEGSPESITIPGLEGVTASSPDDFVQKAMAAGYTQQQAVAELQMMYENWLQTFNTKS